jgi:primary-amine oxidase
LSAGEIVTAFRTIEAHRSFPKGAFFPIVALQEPPKAEVLSWSPGKPFSRRASANIYDRARNRLYEAVVDLREKHGASWVRRPRMQPAVWADEFADAEALIRADKRWQQAIRRRGISPKDVYIDVWAPGEVRLPGARPRHRFLRGLSFYQHALGTKKQQPNPHDRPIEGVIATADMTTMRVISVIDSGIRPTAIGVSGSAPRGPKLAR